MILADSYLAQAYLSQGDPAGSGGGGGTVFTYPYPPTSSSAWLQVSPNPSQVIWTKGTEPGTP